MGPLLKNTKGARRARGAAAGFTATHPHSGFQDLIFSPSVIYRHSSVFQDLILSSSESSSQDWSFLSGLIFQVLIHTLFSSVRIFRATPPPLPRVARKMPPHSRIVFILTLLFQDSSS